MFPCHHCLPPFLTFHELFFMNIEQILALRVNCVEAGFRPFTSTKLVNLGVKIPPIPPPKMKDKTRDELLIPNRSLLVSAAVPWAAVLMVSQVHSQFPAWMG